nr:MAG TPA: hypothetical protein [Bacteriophage sp.]
MFSIAFLLFVLNIAFFLCSCYNRATFLLIGAVGVFARLSSGFFVLLFAMVRIYHFLKLLSTLLSLFLIIFLLTYKRRCIILINIKGGNANA